MWNPYPLTLFSSKREGDTMRWIIPNPSLSLIDSSLSLSGLSISFIILLIIFFLLQNLFPSFELSMLMDLQEEHIGSFSSINNEAAAEADSCNSIGSSSSELMEDATSLLSSNGDLVEEEEGPLFEMSNLIAQLPFKRALSKYFEGKSQSFSSNLSSVKSLEDLAKHERPLRKKLMKSSKTYGGELNCYKALSCSRSMIRKRVSKSSFCSMGSKSRSFSGNSRPPMPSQRSARDLSRQTLLFA